MISLDKPQRKWASSRLEGRSSLIFRIAAGALDVRRGLRDPLWWPQETPVPMRVARGTLGITLPSMPGPKTLCGVGAGTRGFLSSADLDLGILLESPQESQFSSRVGTDTCAFLPSCSSSVTLPFAWIKGSEAYPRSFPTTLSHRAVPRATVVLVDPPLESRSSAGKQVSLEWTETSGGLCEWWHDRGVPLAFSVETTIS